MNRDNLVSLCTPVTAADAGLGNWLGEVTALLAAAYENYEIVLIGNGLRGPALAVIRAAATATPHTRLVALANQHDEDILYSAALDTAIGDAVLLTDYRTDPVSLLLPMLEKTFAGAGITLAHNLTPPVEPVWYRLLAAIYYRLVKFLVRTPPDFDRGHFSAYARAAVNLMTRHHGRIRNLRLLRNTLGVDTVTVDYRQPVDPAFFRHRRITLASRVFARAEEALSFSVRPLRLTAMLCLMAAIVNIFYSVYIILARLLTATAPGWASSELAQSAMLSVLFFALGIIAMNLNIILQETRRRPLYTVIDEYGAAPVILAEKRNVVA